MTNNDKTSRDKKTIIRTDFYHAEFITRNQFITFIVNVLCSGEMLFEF